MSFGKRLQGYRKEKGLSQEALANQLYVTRQSISQWENDKTMPSVDLLLKIREDPRRRAFPSLSVRRIFSAIKRIS